MTDIEKQDKEAHLINLLSRGFTMQQAREHVYGKQDEPVAPVAQKTEDEEVEALRQVLTDAGIPFHHKAGKAKLTAILEDSKLL